MLSAQPQQRWIVDSEATNNSTPHLHLFHSFVPMTRPCFIIVPNGKQVQLKHIGTIFFTANITLYDVLHVSKFQFNLLLASKLAKHLSYSVVLTATSCYIQDRLRNEQQVLGEEKRGLYLVNSSTHCASQ